jgi:acylphosphatase
MNTESDTVCMRCIITGRVQGVFFRYSTREEALNLGIEGHARNLPDGSVEVLACGRTEALERLRQWLAVGPPAARVSRVDCSPVEGPRPTGFTTG